MPHARICSTVLSPTYVWALKRSKSAGFYCFGSGIRFGFRSSRIGRNDSNANVPMSILVDLSRLCVKT